ncbi:MAG: DMT family transporter [Novipirellula sp. JB048]
MNQEFTALDRRRAILALVVVNALWGASFPIVKALNLQIDDHFGVTQWTASNWLRISAAGWVIGLRFGIAFLLLAILLRGMLARVRSPHLFAGAAIGLLFCCGLLLQVIGLATIPASRSGFITSLVVILTPILNTLVRRQLPRRCVMLGAVVALIGVATLTGLITLEQGRVAIANNALAQWTSGDTLTVVAALFFSGQILLIDLFGKRYESVLFTPSMFATVSIFALAVFAGASFYVPEAHLLEAHTGGWIGLAIQPRFALLLAVLCFFPSLIAFMWMNKYQPRLTAGQAAVIYTLEPLFASSWAMFTPAIMSALCAIQYANEQFSAPLIVGGSLVMLANVVALWPERTRERTVKRTAMRRNLASPAKQAD